MKTQSSSFAAPLASRPATPGLAAAALWLLEPAAGGLGGLRGLEAAFASQGLGERFASWVGTGANLPVSAAEIERALGPAVASMARASRKDPAALAAGLAEILPRVVDGLTPHGRLPAGGRLQSLWALARLLLARPVRSVA